MEEKHVEYDLVFRWVNPRNECIPIITQTTDRGPNSVLTFIDSLGVQECEGFIEGLQRCMEFKRNVDLGFESDSVEHMSITFEYPDVNIDHIKVPMEDMAMMLQEWKTFRQSRLPIIDQKLTLLKLKDNKLRTFGATHHNYKNQRTAESAVLDFEDKNNITIPNEFRLFLTMIGAGAGPDLGIFDLFDINRQYQEFNKYFNDDSKMSLPFSFGNKDVEEHFLKMESNPEQFSDFKLSDVNGLLPIQTEGCTYHTFLVLNGEQRGRIWFLNNNEGISVLPGGTNRGLTFFEWYEAWLDKSMATLDDEAPSISPLEKPHKEKAWWKNLFSNLRDNFG